MREYLIAFLKALEAAIPPPPNCHHAITYAQYGSDETGWEDRLAIQVNHMGVFHCWFIDPGDFDGAPQALVDQIAKLLPTPTPGEQIGVATGQYVGVGTCPQCGGTCESALAEVGPTGHLVCPRCKRILSFVQG